MQKKKTKIVATMGPASSDKKLLTKMISAGLNVARLNFSHGDHAEHLGRAQLVRSAATAADKRVAILQDLSGPKIRTGDLEEGQVTLKPGKQLVLTAKKMLGNAEKMSITYPKLAQELKVGDRILINDGKQELRVTKISGEDVVTKIIYGGTIKPRRGVNLPDSDLSISALTAKDKKDLAFAVEHIDPDFVAFSFVRTAADIHQLRRLLDKHGSDAMIVAKLETPQAIENLDEIIEATDAVMVARGDLAVEIGAEKVPMVQKEIVRKSNALGKPVIVATQMLESMIDSPSPTRAEVSDVSNAILDGADAVMLSAESAMGDFPLKAIEVMRDVALDTEQHKDSDRYLVKDYLDTRFGVSDVITRYAAKAAIHTDAVAIVALSQTGATARMIARFHVKQPIVVISPSERVLNQSMVSFGAYPGNKMPNKKPDVIELARKSVLERKMAKKGDKVVLVSGSIYGKSGETNTITVITV